MILLLDYYPNCLEKGIFRGKRHKLWAWPMFEYTLTGRSCNQSEESDRESDWKLTWKLLPSREIVKFHDSFMIVLSE